MPTVRCSSGSEYSTRLARSSVYEMGGGASLEGSSWCGTPGRWLVDTACILPLPRPSSSILVRLSRRSGRDTAPACRHFDTLGCRVVSTLDVADHRERGLLSGTGFQGVGSDLGVEGWQLLLSEMWKGIHMAGKRWVAGDCAVHLTAGSQKVYFSI